MLLQTVTEFVYLGININHLNNMHNSHNKIKLRISAINKEYFASEKLLNLNSYLKGQIHL